MSGPGVKPGECRDTGEYVLGHHEPGQAGGQAGELHGLQALGEEVVRQVETLEVDQARDVLSKLSDAIVGEVEMFNICEKFDIGTVTKDVSHHGVGDRDGLEPAEPDEVPGLETLDEAGGDLDTEDLAGGERSDVGEISGGVEVSAVEDEALLQLLTVTVGDDHLRQEGEDGADEDDQQRRGHLHLRPCS